MNFSFLVIVIMCGHQKLILQNEELMQLPQCCLKCDDKSSGHVCPCYSERIEEASMREIEALVMKEETLDWYRQLVSRASLEHSRTEEHI